MNSGQAKKLFKLLTTTRIAKKDFKGLKKTFETKHTHTHTHPTAKG